MTTDGVNNCIMSFTKVLDDIFSPYCCKEIVITDHNNRSKNASKCSNNKPWFDEKCIQLRKLYLQKLKLFNDVHSHFNRSILVTSKRNYKQYERKLKREYTRYQGDKIEYLKKKNPKEFYKLFRKKKGNPVSSLNISGFYEHFKQLSSTDQDIQPPRTNRTEIDSLFRIE